MADHAKQVINRHRTAVWIGIGVFSAILIAYAFFGMTASNFEYTFLRGSPPGTLRNDRLSVNFWFTGSIIVLFLVPLTSALMSDNPLQTWRVWAHVIVLLFLWIYFAVVLGLYSDNYAHANEATAANARNQANDDRWCCVYFGLPGSECLNTMACVPAVPPAELGVNSVFLYKFWFNVVVLVLMVVDFIYTMFWFKPAANDYIVSIRQKRENQLLPPSDPETAALYGEPPQQARAAIAAGRYKGRRQ